VDQWEQQLLLDPITKQISAESRPPVIIPLSMIRINDIVLAGVGGDVSSDMGVHFKTASPVAHSTMITMVGDSVGYVLSDASYEHPGHKLMKSTLAPHCADRAIVDGLVKLIGPLSGVRQ
jgi:neutral ceramidase